MVKEYQSIIKNDVWEIVPRPKDKLVVSSKWIFKTKHSTDGSINNYAWELVPRPKNKSMLSSNWIYKTKHSSDGSIDKYKEIFVACGFS